MERERHPVALPLGLAAGRHARHVHGLDQPGAGAVDGKRRTPVAVGLLSQCSAIGHSAHGRPAHGLAAGQQLHGQRLAGTEGGGIDGRHELGRHTDRASEMRSRSGAVADGNLGVARIALPGGLVGFARFLPRRNHRVEPLFLQVIGELLALHVDGLGGHQRDAEIRTR